ncbi:efflux RND transporter periplasmic adaptor subunit [Stenotrophomonas sp. C3(2023)]|uniref:efflux RND transporter periplasmic adaptor subunit n=1 Tax=Stenotrophomonas sp. C3(2023) TaxID=3080277 RepID=UPI00293C4522|nr:efflux RND transporter periplasmic adaptor subunit [Stenotrophomonas sp. C3(2023)]MDV3470132.1 efflux RND transporter periplasmic adaptor subunit [Stenotrophomonas sp. C3(2023)]
MTAVAPLLRSASLVLLAALLAACGGGQTPPVAPPSAGTAADQSGGHDDHDDHNTSPSSTTIADAQAEAAGIVVAAVGPGTIADEHDVQGLLAPVDGRTAQVTARFPGPVRALRANVGDRVRAGQALASIESNLSLTTYSVAAPISGVVLSRQVQVGAVAGEGQVLFDIGDLSQLWVDLHIFGADTQHIMAGVPVTVTRMTDGVSQSTMLERVLPGTATASQSTVARAIVLNSDGLWRPGAAVRARIVVASTPAALVVPLSALQTLDGQEVVFVREAQTYTARTVQLGARDAQQVEVISGLTAGEQVVVQQSYVIKADIGKAGAAHEH